MIKKKHIIFYAVDIHESYEISGRFMEVIGKTVSVNPGSEYGQKDCERDKRSSQVG